ASSPPAAAGRNGIWPPVRIPSTPRYNLGTPFFPARQTGLPDLVGHVEPRITELVFDGSKLLVFRHVDGSFDHAPQGLFHLGPKLLHQLFDTFVTRSRDGSVLAGTSHGCLLGTRSGGWTCHLPCKLRAKSQNSHPSTSCSPTAQGVRRISWTAGVIAIILRAVRQERTASYGNQVSPPSLAPQLRERLGDLHAAIRAGAEDAEGQWIAQR